jgi:hypothetical protein
VCFHGGKGVYEGVLISEATGAAKR